MPNSSPQRQSDEESELFRLLVENVQDYALFVVDPDGLVRTWNHGAERLLGYPADEIIGRSAAVFYTPEDDRNGVPQKEMRDSLEHGRGNDDRWHVRKDGSRFWSGDTLTPLRDEHGRVRGFAMIMRDRTEWKRRDEAVEEQTRLARFMKDIGLALTRTDDVPEMLRHCTEAIVRHLDGAFARIWTLNTQENSLELRSSAGMYTHLDGPHSRIPVGKYKIGLIAQERQPHLTNSVVGDPRVGQQDWAVKEGMIAFAGYPLIVDDRVVGVMAMFARHPLTEATLEAMAAVANGIALGIERKAAEEESRRRQEWFQVTLNSIGDAVIATDTAGQVTFLNGIAEQLTGWTVAEAKGRLLTTVFPIFNEKTRQPVENPVDKVLREGAIVGMANHTVLVSKDGTVRPIDDSAAPIRDMNGTLIGVVMVFRDVTEQRRSEHELFTSDARKRAMLESALDCIISMDHEGKVVEFNPAAERTFGYRSAEAIGKELADLIVPESLRSRHRQGMAHYLATGEGPVLGKRLELPARHADGYEFPVELAITRIASEGQPLFTAYVRDLTQQKRADQYRNARTAVTAVLSEAATVGEGGRGVLQAICENLDWDVGFLWMSDADGRSMACRESWHRQDLPITHFETASRSRRFDRGEGLIGDVWATGQAKWLLDVSQNPNFPRAASAEQDGLHSALACPIAVGDHTLGVIEFYVKRLREPDGDLIELMETVTGSIGQFLERKAAEEQVRRSEWELADFFDNATVGLHWVGPDGIILRANQAELRLLGYCREEYVGRLISDFHADEEVICDILSRLQAGEDLHEYPARLKCKDGSIKDVLIDSSVLFRDSRFVHTRCFTRDVTQRKRLEQTTRFLADASASLAVLVDFDSTLQKVASLAVPHFADWVSVDVLEDNGTLRRVAVAHVDPAKVQLAHEIHRRFPPDPTAPSGVWNILKSGQSEIVSEMSEERLVQSIKDDELLEIIRKLGLKSYLGVPLTVRGKTLGVLTFIAAESGHVYDDTDLAVAEDLASRAAIAVENAQLYRQLRDADRRKDEFLATLAHELRNPLAPIRNGLEVLRLAGGGSEMVEKARSMMERQLGQMVRLVDDLLDVSRITCNKLDLKKERITLAEVVHSAVETSRPLIERSGHTFSLTLPSMPIYFDADFTRLAQVISNLLNNSAKYTPPSGRISLSAEVQGREIFVRVKDNGLGIPAEALPHLFQMFSQVDLNMERAQGGLGIGLTLVRRLTEMHGGSVEARSEGPGLGSEFTVRLPVSADEIVAPITPSQNDALKAATKRRILVVDDNHDSAMSLGMMLKLLGNETRTAHDGLSAIAAAEDFRPDLILLDIGLPTLNGYDACIRIRQQPWSQGMVIVALTGWGQDEDRKRSAEAGFDHHMVKPVEIAALQQLLGRGRPERSKA